MSWDHSYLSQTFAVFATLDRLAPGIQGVVCRATDLRWFKDGANNFHLDFTEEARASCGEGFFTSNV